MTWTRAALGLAVAIAAAAALVSGGAREDSVRRHYLPESNELRTIGRYGSTREADVTSLGEPGLLRAAPAWLARARRLAPDAPRWARRMYRRSLLVMRALTRPDGAVPAGLREGWEYVWPRDAGSVALAFSAAGYRAEARRVARFLLGLDLGAAARFEVDGSPAPGRAAQGDAAGWVAVAARAAGLRPPGRRLPWRNRADYQESAPGDYIGNALAAAAASPADGVLGGSHAGCSCARLGSPGPGSTRRPPGPCGRSLSRRSTQPPGARCCGSPPGAAVTASSRPRAGAAATIPGPRRRRGSPGASPRWRGGTGGWGTLPSPAASAAPPCA